ncbi:discoidin domain-containing protein [Endozoicomonas sp. G2_1]|uniref:galactose-binding domain-containing protein n=1 Tax=Endozoicomonas sp. G2_1 TaxID=2821091 RepID=UPI001ADD3C44|nr:discoidin domain-containing protein [Endozoicomonas sp. G2_1]MBO9489738.1 discoidin domain-containing protein [Endozoicomonas sp. G2_1]
MNKNQNKITCAVLSNLFLTTGVLAFAAFNVAAVDIYVSPTGNDFFADGSASAPYKTLHRAQMQARNIARPLTEEINIILKDGTYYLSSPLNLTAADSGSASYKVTYRAENPGQATVSGGSPVTGWSDVDNDGIWQATVPAGMDSRQLYVNDQRATRARSVNGAGWARNGSGYSTPAGVANWGNHSDIELVFGFRWKMYRGGVASVSGNQATMDAEFFSASAMGPFGLVDQGAGVLWAENAFELLDSDGEWYHNKSTNTLYYNPKVGENLTGPNAVSVVMPRLEKLVDGNGVSHVEFDGLTFAHATWLLPNQPVGYVSIQSGVTLRDDINFRNIEDAFDGITEMPGNLHFVHSENIVFKNNRFVHLGANGIAFARGTRLNTVFNNVFEDISGSAVGIGTAQDHHIEDPSFAVKDNLIDNNLVRFVSVEYDDNPGITSLWAERTVITNNTVEDVPYTGISIGWGWGRYDVDEWAFTTDNSGKAYNDETQLKETLVLENQITRSMLVRHDGGGVYNLSSNMNSRVTGNVVTQALDLNGAVYLDNGSRGFQVDKNVSYNNTGPRLNLHINTAGGPPSYHNIPTTGPNANDWSGGSPNFQPSSQAIVDAAGRKANPVQRTVADIVASLPAALPLPPGTTPPANGLVVGKTARASSNTSTAGNAIDANAYTYWYAGDGQTSGWWQVDLGSPIGLDHVSLAFGRVDGNNEVNYIKNNITFGIQGSVDGTNFTDLTFRTFGGLGVTIPPTTSYTNLQAINDTIIQGNPTARYVRINVTDSNNQNFGLLRVKVTGETSIDPVGNNIAVNGTATQSSTIFGGTADKAIDGNTNGTFVVNGGSVTHTADTEGQPSWTLDLGSVEDLNSIRIYNRTDCCSGRLNNFHVFVSDSPFTGTSVSDSQNQANVLDLFRSDAVGTRADFAVNRSGRYVRIQAANEVISGDNVLTIAEVEVYSSTTTTPPSSGNNLALAGTASQISTLFGGVASRAIDDNTNGLFGGGSVIHTGDHPEPYWTLDLGEVKQIDTLKLFNRTDPCCTDALEQFHIFVSDTAFTGTSVAASQAQANVMTIDNTGVAGASEDYQVNRTGRYIRIQKNTNSTTRSLVFAELQVFGSDVSTTPTNLALTGTASQSTTLSFPGFDFSADQAIDGNTSGNVGDNSLSHTDLASQGYWEVDLGEVKTIDNVVIWNRTDCCSSRLTNFHVLVSDVPFAGETLAVAQATAGVFDHQNAGTAGNSTDISVNRSGRYVRVQLANTAVNGENVLTLAEVQVFGQ